MEDYFKSTFEDNLLVKMPQSEANHLTPATRLLEKRREMSEVEQALSAQKEEFQMKMETLQQRRDELERKEQQLKESLLKFDKFLKENDLKRARALKKTKAEQDLGRQKDREMARLTEEIDELSTVVARQKKMVAKYGVYQQFMEKVLELSEEFDETREIIARHDTLVHTREDLLDHDHENQDDIEAERLSLKKFTEEKNNEILSYNNELAHLQTRLEQAEGQAVKWESEWTRIQTTSAQKTLLLGQIKMATHNLFALMCKHLHRKMPPQETDQTLLQLDKIHAFIKDLTDITNEIKRHESAVVPNPQLLGPVNVS